MQTLCEVADIARSSYYKWLKHTPSSREVENQQLTQDMLALHQKVSGIYGYRRLTLNLSRQAKKQINHKRIQRLMRIQGIQSVIRRKKRKYVYVAPEQVAENLLNREFYAEETNEKWLTDVTELKYGNGQKAYLSAILDLHDNVIVSYEMGHANNNELVFRTIDSALKAASDSKPMLHSDRGFQYTSHTFKRLYADKLTQSMSRVGRCIDNGPMESFWGALKCEKYYLRRTYPTFEELQNDIDEYICFYNNDRLQKKLNGLSPMEFRTKAA
ncbi:Transposase InsO and inactivated derivatives [Paenibacillus sp. OV219]|nr:Transposase InsO and inactivated derivatives [Paenibacillus sp. OV219]